MITFVFTLDDLARSRFAISPMWELISALRAMRDPAWAALHLPWVTEALPIARGIELDLALALTPAEGYIPDFITPPPSTPLASFEDELELVRSTTARQVRADLEDFASVGHRGPVLEAFAAHPRREVTRLCRQLEEFWHLAVEPEWARVRSVLEADLRYRSRQLTEGGPARLFEGLHPALRWQGDRLEWDHTYETEVDLRGKGLLLVPSAFGALRPSAITDPPWQPTLLYPSRGLGLLWEPGSAGGPDELAELIGRTRADLLASLTAPRSTTELARSLELSPGGISQQLAVLRRSGLVSANREGRSVLYLRTPAADRLLAAAEGE